MADDRWILGIETATPTPFLMLSKGKDLISHLWLSQGTAVSNELFITLQKLLAEANVSLADLSFVATGLGPGSYTGMRVGYVVAEMLAFSLNKPLIGFSSLSGWIPLKPGRFAACLDARMGRVYLQEGVKEGNKIEWEEPYLSSVEEIKKKSSQFSCLVTCPNGTIKDLHLEWLEEKPDLAYLSQMLERLSEKASNQSQIHRPKLYYLQEPYIHLASS